MEDGCLEIVDLVFVIDGIGLVKWLFNCILCILVLFFFRCVILWFLVLFLGLEGLEIKESVVDFGGKINGGGDDIFMLYLFFFKVFIIYVDKNCKLI